MYKMFVMLFHILQADTKGKGTIPAVQAANFLKKSGLKESILSEVWT